MNMAELLDGTEMTFLRPLDEQMLRPATSVPDGMIRLDKGTIHHIGVKVTGGNVVMDRDLLINITPGDEAIEKGTLVLVNINICIYVCSSVL